MSLFNPLYIYRLNADESIQMVTALVLQLIQCVVKLPNDDDEDDKGSNESDSKVYIAFHSIISCIFNLFNNIYKSYKIHFDEFSHLKFSNVCNIF